MYSFIPVDDAGGVFGVAGGVEDGVVVEPSLTQNQ